MSSASPLSVKRETRVSSRRSAAACRRRRGSGWSRSSGPARCPMRPFSCTLETGMMPAVTTRAVGLDDVDLARDALDVERAPVLGDGELHRALGVVVERGDLEVARDRRRGALLAAVRRDGAGGGADAAEELRAEVRLGERARGVAHRRVPGAAAVVVGAPDDRMVVGRGAVVGLVVGRLVDGLEDVHARAARAPVDDAGLVAADHGVRRRLEVVPLVRAHPGGRDAGGRGLVGVLGQDGRLRRAGRVVAEVTAEHLAVPRPRVLGVGRGVDADVAACRTGCSARTRPAARRRGCHRSSRGR